VIWFIRKTKLQTKPKEALPKPEAHTAMAYLAEKSWIIVLCLHGAALPKRDYRRLPYVLAGKVFTGSSLDNTIMPACVH
jgi:hypothetical protein